MSQIPPALATPARARSQLADFVRPMALATLLVTAAMIVWFLLQALLAWPLVLSQPWQLMIMAAEEYKWPASVVWMMTHPVITSLLLAAVCVPSLISSWGLYKGRRWGLLSFVWLLVITGIGNVYVAWWLDRTVGELLSLMDDRALTAELQVDRLMFTLTVVGSSLLFAVLQGWLAWRLMRPDIRSRY